MCMTPAGVCAKKCDGKRECVFPNDEDNCSMYLGFQNISFHDKEGLCVILCVCYV